MYGRVDRRGSARAGGLGSHGGGLPQAWRGNVFISERPSSAGLKASEAKRLKALEDENGRRLERMLADSMLDNAALKDLPGKSGDARGTTGGDDVSRQTFEISERRACRVIGTDRTNVR